MLINTPEPSQRVGMGSDFAELGANWEIFQERKEDGGEKTHHVRKSSLAFFLSNLTQDWISPRHIQSLCRRCN